MNNIIIIGGDMRQTELKRLLSEKSLACRHIFSFNKNQIEIKHGDVVVFPVPVTKDKVSVYSSKENVSLKLMDIVKQLDGSNVIFGGNFPDIIKEYFKNKVISFIDYFDCEEFIQYNAYLTGLGALKILLEKTDCDICGKKVLITGFGRVARFTARSLNKAGCDVYIAVRNINQLTEAECYGYKIIKLSEINAFVSKFDFIFNTVPANVFTSEDINNFHGQYFELASAPFGVRREYFKEKERAYINAGSLPGRYLCTSAAEILSKIILDNLKIKQEMGEING